MPDAPRPRSWPPVIHMLAAEVAELAKGHALHGKVRISQAPDGAYVVALVIPASETVGTRAAGR